MGYDILGSMPWVPKDVPHDTAACNLLCALRGGWANARGAAFILAISAVALLAGCANERGKGDDAEVVLAAAASLSHMIEALTPLAEAAGLELVTNFAGSNVLAMQIDATPAADVFISADPAWIDHLSAHGRLRMETHRPLLSNRLVVIGHATQDTMPAGICGERGFQALARKPPAFLILADPEAVPAGRYARQVLESVTLPDGTSLWNLLGDRIVPTADVRAALAMVDARADAYGIVYATDAADARRARVLFEVPADHTPVIRYVAAAVAGREHPERADRLLALLTSPQARSIFTRHGFSSLTPSVSPPAMKR